MLRRTALLVALAVALCTPPSVHADPPPVYQVIVNPNNPYTSVPRRFLVDAFLKKTTTWASGDVIRPVDLGPKSPVRARFSEDVLRRSVAEVKSYWQQRIFSGGDVPPPELASDEEVVSYVLKYPWAVGYVSGGAKLDGTKTVTIR
jgi:ABC-type phosphate transport system substrate-binding protein